MRRKKEAFIQSAEEEEPDELDLQMIAEAETENDGSAIPFEDMARELGIPPVCR